MAFCKYSSSFMDSGVISLDTKFLNDYLPYAPENCVKVYLFGLLKCENSATYDNSIENFTNVLGLSKQEVIDCFIYWKEQNLVKILDLDPIEVQYLPLKNANATRKYDTKRYSEFVKALTSIITGRVMLPNEIAKYVDFIEAYNFQWGDFLMIVKYCVERKGADINSNYILTVAQVWADEGVRTAEKIEEKIENMTLMSSKVSEVAKAIKFRSTLSIEHQQFYSKWTKSFGFNHNTILELAKRASLRTKVGFEYLDKMLTKYYELKLLSLSEIDAYESKKQELSSLAREINRALGLYYESVDSEIETYVLPWLSRGFEREALIQIANFCFKNSTKTLEGMDSTVQKFSKIGLTTLSSINNYLSEVLLQDSKIKQILQNLGLDRRVNNFDRSFYRTWTYTYKFGEDIINYAVELGKAKANMGYVGGILSSWFESGFTTLEQVKKAGNSSQSDKKQTFATKSFGADNYTSEQVSALFDNLEEVNL